MDFLGCFVFAPVRDERYQKRSMYVIQPTERKLKGASINLRNFSNSDIESKARCTIDINIKKQSDNARLWDKEQFELKFQ
ncbi:TPA: hypothetical protein QB072_001777 [Pasteurella multocida]|uniref:hypothetical protein n=1 Tax=Pasteurella multocida TaxID=747 RepID=UPI000518D6C3|nr:hypothetical protein [Pasteurella multocida]APB79021.1 hypothetical protein BMF22_02790 [Pasteurella multocida]KLT46781.1 hypothetical protein PVACC_10620 [Pasteurella multocida subsp. multocida]KLT49216.1 hypothetical protein PMMV1_10610 [Pasteurella multocida subsp. multocida]KLT53242.1 hypothetical protein PMTHA_10315 [Pasteurella multocida subsp. multocida]KLT53530.1 hypothetical protein ISLM_10455 [Pasteurella multocida subsp. multocida]